MAPVFPHVRSPLPGYKMGHWQAQLCLHTCEEVRASRIPATQLMGKLRSWLPQIRSDSYYDPKKEKHNNHKNNLLTWSQDMCTLVIYLLCYLCLSLSLPQTKLNHTRQWAGLGKGPLLWPRDGACSANSRYAVQAG